MKRLLSIIIDALMPPAADVQRARHVSEAAWVSLWSPHTVNMAWITTCLPYRDARVRALVHAVKYHGEIAALTVPGKLLGEYLLDLSAEKQTTEGWSRPFLVPIPASSARLRQRGYNQTERIARAAFAFADSAVTYAPDILKRHERESQVSAAREARAANIAGAFFVPHPERVRGHCILLIDDVVETGATLSDARRALMAAGARDICAVALAH